MERKENKMGVMPVKRLIISMSLPMMVSMLVQALYNVVDSIFVARLSEQALTAVTLAFPLQNLMLRLAGKDVYAKVVSRDGDGYRICFTSKPDSLFTLLEIK